MSTRWTLHVENFAKIKSADIEIAPFVGIVGENNTGKSYLMSLLWGLMTQSYNFFSDESYWPRAEFLKCRDMLEGHAGTTFFLSDDEIKELLGFYNAWLRLHMEEILERIFNYSVRADSIEIRGYWSDKKYEITFSKKWEDEKLRYEIQSGRPGFTISGGESFLPAILFLTIHMLLFNGINGNCIYFPASRTGFMLTYPQLVGQSLEDNYSLATEPRTKTQLTLPYIRFLQFITSYKEAEDNNPDEPFADFVENELTHGRIMSTEAKMPILTYRPDGSEKNLPLHVSSSVVTEVAPLLMAFRDKEKRGVYFIEEPEAHLHPELQKKMAQLLIRMSNGGKGVFITTHSDTIIQHINNMLMLGKTDSKDLMTKYGYKTEDLLKTENVKLYQFVHDEDGMSILMPLEKTDYGFVVPTFNDSLKNLLDETYAFQGE